MENITLGQVGLGLAFLVALITGISFIVDKFKEFITDSLKDNFDGVNKHIDELETKITTVDMEQTKSFLVRCIGDIEDGGISETELQRFFEQYEHYLAMDGNTYIKHKVEQLMQEGRI